MSDAMVPLLMLQQAGRSGDGPGGLVVFVALLAVVIAVIGWWRLFAKAGRPGWYSLIPIWNAITLLDIVGRPWWWLLLFFIPIANFIVHIVVALDLGKSFGRSTAFSVVLLILFPVIGYLILAYGGSEYRGPAGKGIAGTYA